MQAQEDRSPPKDTRKDQWQLQTQAAGLKLPGVGGGQSAVHHDGGERWGGRRPAHFAPMEPSRGRGVPLFLPCLYLQLKEQKGICLHRPTSSVGRGEGPGGHQLAGCSDITPKGELPHPEAENSVSSSYIESLHWNDPRGLKNCKEPFMSHPQSSNCKYVSYLHDQRLQGSGSSPKSRWLKATLLITDGHRAGPKAPSPAGGRRDGAWDARSRGRECGVAGLGAQRDTGPRSLR